MKLISVLIPTFEEEKNISNLILEIEKNLLNMDYNYEIIVIDNCSNDNTVNIVKKLIETNKKIRLIVNNNNYGHIKSPFYGLLQTKGDATILMNADYQDPPELIEKLVTKWASGSKIVLLQKNNSEESKIKFFLRKFYYKFLNLISENKMTVNTTGSGIFDKTIIQQLKNINDPYPYFRGLITEIGPSADLLPFTQPKESMEKLKIIFFIYMILECWVL